MKLTCNTRPRVEVWSGRGAAVAAAVLAALVFAAQLTPGAHASVLVVASAPQADGPQTGAQEKQDKLTPEQTMARRFPQPVRVGALIGLPVLDGQDSTIGYIQQVVRTPQGKIQLVVPYNPRLGWIRNGGWLDRWRRAVAVPIETVALLARQVDALEMPRQDFETAPTFQPMSAVPLGPDQQISIALARR